MRTFQQTHPWLTFQLDLRQAPWMLWVRLGECQSKCEHVAGVPLRPQVAQQLYQLYLAKGVLATTAIEGNTLSEQQVNEHLAGRLHLPPSQDYLRQEIDNIVAACALMRDTIHRGEPLRLSVEVIKELNRLTLRNLQLPDEVVPGGIRAYSVGVARYRGAPAQDCGYLLERLCEWLDGEAFRSPPGLEMVFAMLKAVVAHLYIAWIHPFGDGNGRTARLVEFQIMVASGIPAPSAHLLSNHYNQTRIEYYRQLENASRSGGQVLPFIEYAVYGLLDGLRQQLGVIRAQQLDVVWRSYVQERLRSQSSAARDRWRDLVLDMSLHPSSVTMGEVPNLSPRVARVYASMSSKTLARDLLALQKLGLIEKTAAGYRAAKDRIEAFLPPRWQPPPGETFAAGSP